MTSPDPRDFLVKQAYDELVAFINGWYKRHENLTGNELALAIASLVQAHLLTMCKQQRGHLEGETLE